MNFLYWNVNGKDVADTVMDAVIQHSIDVLVLSECNFVGSSFIKGLNSQLDKKLGLVFNTLDDPKILTSLPTELVVPLLDSEGLSIVKFLPPIGPEFLLAAVHLPSKMFRDPDDQTQVALRLARDIGRIEEDVGHKRTIVLGDFNMNPFDPGMVGSESLHSVMTKTIASKGSRKVRGEERHFFYNPMWNHFGESHSLPAGSYYYQSSKEVAYYWHIFDQVLIRPDLLAHFEEDSLQILACIGSASLTNSKNIPIRTKFSDHLPIKFSLNLVKGI